MDVFGEIERVVAVASEILSEVDRELGDRVAVVFDAFGEGMEVAGLAISSGVANGDRVIIVEVVSCPAS